MVKQNEKISIIIPVYNVEKYLEQCLNSVLNQTYKNIEIICINDGSTDKSLNILKKFSSKDDRIKCFSRENRGLLFTRVDGVKKSSGKYITFLDSDDWIDPDYIETLYNALINNNCDLSRCNLKFVSNEGDIIKFQEDFIDNLYNREDIILSVFSDFCTSYKFNNTVKQLIKKDLLKDIDKIDTSISMGEDLEFNLSFYDKIQSITTVKYHGYNYRYNPNSITKNLKKVRLEKNLYDEIKVYFHLCEFIKQNNPNLLKKSFCRFLYQVTSHLMRVSLSEDINYSEFCKITSIVTNNKNFALIRKNIQKKDINKFSSKKRLFQKLLYTNNLRIFNFLTFYIYRQIRRKKL